MELKTIYEACLLHTYTEMNRAEFTNANDKELALSIINKMLSWNQATNKELHDLDEESN